MKPRLLIVAAALAALLAGWLGLSSRWRSPHRVQPQESAALVSRNEKSRRDAGPASQTEHWIRGSQFDPAKTIRNVLETANGDAEELARLADGIPLSQIPAILTEISASETDSLHDALASLLVRKWARHAPLDAARWLASLPAGVFPSSIFEQVIAEWAARDVPAMLAWVRQLPESESKHAALLSAGFEAAARKQATTAASLAADLAPGPERDRLLGYSVLQWMNEDPSGAMTWANRVPDPALRESLLAKVAVELSVQNEARAASHIATTLVPGAARQTVVSQILQCWARSEPRDAAAWATESAGDDLQPTAVDNLISVWAQRDWLEASKWVMQLPPGRAFDAGARRHAFLLKSAHPDLARDVAELIGDDLERAAVLRELSQKPAVENPEATATRSDKAR